MIKSDPTDFSGAFIGIVADEPDAKKHRVPVFIPKLMPAIPRYEETKESTVNITNLITDIKTQETVQTPPYMWVYQKDIYDPMPKKGDRVWIYFLDNLPYKGYCTPFNPYSTSDEKIPTPPTLFTLVIGDKSVPVKQGSQLMITLPNDLETTSEIVDDTKVVINIKKK